MEIDFKVKVEKHFENAKIIECIADKKLYDISTLKLVQNNELGDKFYSFCSTELKSIHKIQNLHFEHTNNELICSYK